MRQTGVWLPHSTYDELKRTGGERGLGDEIRRRLEISLKADQALHGSKRLTVHRCNQTD